MLAVQRVFSIPPDFWPAVVERYWGQRPVALRQPLVGALAVENDIFAALCELGRRLASGDERIPFRLSKGGEPHREPEAWLPAASDRDFAGYARRLGEGGDYGLIVNNFQALHEDIWRRSLRFLGGLYAEVGIPFGGALIDFITGNYRESFLGFHKDDQDIFTFVVAGQKRLLCWPFELFRDAAGLSDDDRGASFELRGFDWRPYRDQAIVLEGGPGDVFYWPASYWHIAEGDGRTAPLTLTVSVIHRGNPTLRVALAQSGGAEALDLHPFCEAGHPLAKHLGRVGRVLAMPGLQRALEEKLLVFATRSGYAMLPEPRPHRALSPSERLRRSDLDALAWLLRDEEVVWAAAGDLHSNRRGEGIETLLTRVSAGGVHAVGEIANTPEHLRVLELLLQHRVLDLV